MYWLLNRRIITFFFSKIQNQLIWQPLNSKYIFSQINRYFHFWSFSSNLAYLDISPSFFFLLSFRQRLALQGNFIWTSSQPVGLSRYLNPRMVKETRFLNPKKDTSPPPNIQEKLIKKKTGRACARIQSPPPPPENSNLFMTFQPRQSISGYTTILIAAQKQKVGSFCWTAQHNNKSWKRTG